MGNGLLNLKWSRYIPPNHFPTPKQIAFLSLPHLEAFYGGAAGGGKSDAILMGALQWCDVPGFRALIIRRSVKEAKQSGAILNRAKEWLSPYTLSKEVRYNSSESTFYFPEGASLQFGYLENADDEEQYQGGDWLYVGFDELTHFLFPQYTYLFTRTRFGKGNEHLAGITPIKIRGAGNPGSRGHAWVKSRFQIEKYGEETAPDGKQVGLYRGKDLTRPFIQARLEDNPHISQKKLYEKSLSQADQLRYQRLRWGDWDASPDAIFKQNWFANRWKRKSGSPSQENPVVDLSRQSSYYHLEGNASSPLATQFAPGVLGLRAIHEKDVFLFTTVDSAASERTGVEGRVLSKSKDQEPSWSVCALWGMTNDFDLLWLDMIRGLWTIPDFIDKIVDFHKRQPLPPAFAIIEDNGVGQGVYQAVRSRGIVVRNLPVNADKIVRSTSAQERAKLGRVWLPVWMPWLASLEDELYIWAGRKTETADQIDVLSLAADYVAHKAHGNEMDSDLSAGAYTQRIALQGGLGLLGGSPGSPSRLPRVPGMSHGAATRTGSPTMPYGPGSTGAPAQVGVARARSARLGGSRLGSGRRRGLRM